MSPSRSRESSILLVEPDEALRSALAAAIEWTAFVEAEPTFESARARLASSASGYDVLVTNYRLQAFNGLHLVYLLKHSRGATRAIVYADTPQAGVIADSRRAAAFFEVVDRLAVVIPSYLGAALPDYDRRDPMRFDRRIDPRGGRRAWDVHQLMSAG